MVLKLTLMLKFILSLIFPTGYKKQPLRYSNSTHHLTVEIMSCLGYYWDEFLGLAKLALPTLVVNGLEISMSIIDLIYLGHVSPMALSIGGREIYFGRQDLANDQKFPTDFSPFVLIALGSVYYNMVWYISEGILSAQDSLISHALEMKDQGQNTIFRIVSLTPFQ
jgi:Na+-driven multidrug efflux pump